MSTIIVADAPLKPMPPGPATGVASAHVDAACQHNECGACPVVRTPSLAAAWRDAAPALAGWAFALLLNRRDCWGAYYDPDSRPVKIRADGTTYRQKSWTAPAKRLRGRRVLTVHDLRRHFAGTAVGNLIGLHAVGPGNLSRWGAVDIDKHGDDGDADANLRAALYWHDLLVLLGFCPILSDSNGAGGFHLWVLLAEPVATARLFRFLRWLVRDYADHGLTQAPEVFPKQRAVPEGKFGNWLRLPGLHHSRPRFSTFWVNGDWLGGADAVDFLLSHTPDAACLVPATMEPESAAPSTAARPSPVGGDAAARSYAGSPAVVGSEAAALALDCLAHIPNGPDVHYDTWRNVGFALHSVDKSDAMLAEWVKWSAKSPKHAPGICEEWWRGFRSDREKPVTVRTLVWLARRNGYDPPARDEQAGPALQRAAAAPILIHTKLPDPPARTSSAAIFTVTVNSRGAA